MWKNVLHTLVFLIGYELLLPTSTLGLEWYNGNHFVPPFWMTRMELFKGFFLKDLFVIVLLTKFLLTKTASYSRANINIIYVYLSLGFYGVVIALATLHYYDVFENLRLILMAFTLFLVSQRGDGQKLLQLFFVGVAISGFLNLVVSFQYDIYGLRPFFFLVNQNGPGPIAGLLLFFLPHTSFSHTFKLILAIILISISALSLSKIAYIILFLVLTRTVLALNSVKGYGIVLALILTIYSSGFMNVIFEQKFSSRDVSLVEAKGGDQTRLAYYKAQGHILRANPFGVSYTGFFKAVSNTRYFKDGIIKEESVERANPHSTFLYYMSSHGLFGVVLILWFAAIHVYKYSSDLYVNLAILVYMATIPYFFVSYFYVLPMVLLNSDKYQND